MKNSNPRIEALPWPQGELAVYRWPEGQAHQPRGVVLLVHGLGEHMGRYSETAHFLQEEGWICIGYDHLGHGRSAGARGTLPSSDALVEGLVQVAQHVVAELPSKIAQELPLILLGHSLGGLVVTQALSTASERMPEVRAAVLSAPALGIHLSGLQSTLLKTLPIFAPNLCLDNGLDANAVCRDPEVVRRYLNDPLVHRKISLRLAAWMMDCANHLPRRLATWSTPVFLLLAQKDRLGDNQAAERFAALVPADLVTVHRETMMFHEMLNDPEKQRVLQKIADWMDLAVC